MSAEFENAIKDLWNERVDGRFIYRGMGLHDLQEGLDPGNDPFGEIRPQLFHLISVLEEVLSKGLEFTVHEDYSGMSFSLKNIVAWSRRDLENPGMDFTSLYDNACGYSKNFRGSQFRQNFKYITDHLPEWANDPILKSVISEEDWKIVSLVNSWIVGKEDNHTRIVVWVRRSHSAFDENRRCLPLASLPVFNRNVIQEIEKRSLPITIESAISVLPKESEEFCYRLTTDVHLKDIEEIEKKEA
jgi:hypothetical protein